MRSGQSQFREGGVLLPERHGEQSESGASVSAVRVGAAGD